jgi:hypothetical protein
MSHSATIGVACSAIAAGWQCAVDIDDGASSGRHTVTVAAADAERLAVARGQADVERLVYEAFDFLLDREPRSSILAEFDLPVIASYFPDFDAEMTRRLRP